MERAETLKIQGWFEIEHRDVNGELLERRTIKNLITSAGKAAAAGLLNGVVTDFFEHLALGIGTTAANAADTALESEIVTGGGERASATTSRTTTTVTNDTAQLVYNWTFTDSFAITECGVLSAAAAGVLLARQVFAPINVMNGSTFQITYKVAVS